MELSFACSTYGTYSWTIGITRLTEPGNNEIRVACGLSNSFGTYYNYGTYLYTFYVRYARHTCVHYSYIGIIHTKVPIKYT